MEQSKSIYIPVLIGGEHFTVNYSALLDAEETWHGRVLTLPVKLTFRSSSQVFFSQFYSGLHNFCKKINLQGGSCLPKQ